MTVYQFIAPPLPHYIVSGYHQEAAGSKHLNRRNIGVFDLLFVTSGCLYVGEGGQSFEVSQNHALLLRPDAHHYPTEDCREETGHYWLHFQTEGEWKAHDPLREGPYPLRQQRDAYQADAYILELPQFTRIQQPSKLIHVLDQLTELQHSSHLGMTRWRQEVLFQEVLQLLSLSIQGQLLSPARACAEQAAAFLRLHFREKFSAQELGEHLNFHPVYIARCMQKEYGCSPNEYLIRLRMEQAKLLLLQTSLPISRVAEDSGFNHAAYFTASFSKQEGMTPRMFRQRFSHGAD